MLDLNVPALDLELSEQGKWFVYDGDIRFRIAMHNNPVHRREMRKAAQNNLETIKDGKQEDLLAVSVEAEAVGILVDWEGLSNGNKKFPPTLENKILFLNDPAYMPIREWILQQSQKQENFRREITKK